MPPDTAACGRRRGTVAGVQKRDPAFPRCSPETGATLKLTASASYTHAGLDEPCVIAGVTSLFIIAPVPLSHTVSDETDVEMFKFSFNTRNVVTLNY